jgi:hypothetical protein
MTYGFDTNEHRVASVYEEELHEEDREKSTKTPSGWLALTQNESVPYIMTHY